MWWKGGRSEPDDGTKKLSADKIKKRVKSENPTKRMSKMENSLNREEDSEVCWKGGNIKFQAKERVSRASLRPRSGEGRR